MQFIENPVALGGLLLVATLTSIIAIATQNTSIDSQLAPSKRIEFIEPKSYHDLKNVYASRDSHSSSKVSITRELPDDFNTIDDAKLKKQLFVKTLTPIIALENALVREQRNKVQILLNTGEWPQDERLLQQIQQIAKQYKVKTQDAKIARQILLTRVDQLPLKLVLAQAAIESGWGTSRFALEGNSLFGQWSFSPGSGLTPLDREEGKDHQVKAFKDLQNSVRAYLLNINTNSAYKELRHLRKTLRQKDQPLDAHVLAKGLHRYSQRKHEYVDEVKRILAQRVIKQATAPEI